MSADVEHWVTRQSRRAEVRLKLLLVTRQLDFSGRPREDTIVFQ
jgi:hypothetical protein